MPAVIKFLLSGILLLYSSGCDSSKPADSSPEEQATAKILVFSKTEGYRHASIPDGVQALRQMGTEQGWIVDHTEHAGIFDSDSLINYQAVIFLSTTGDIMNESQQAGFQAYIQQGGGFAGIHAATDTEYQWPWYGRMVGAYFDSHPQVQKARLEVTVQDHPSTQNLPDEWIRTDEWYNFRDINPSIHVLLNLDESSYQGGTNGQDHPAAWYHEFEGGRIFYTAGGHTVESYSEELFLEHIKGGIAYVIGAP